jgi:hypothetical protein
MDRILHIPGLNLRVTRRLIVDLSLHAVITLSLALAAWKLSGRPAWPLLMICGGILIDTDHFIDYFLHLDRWSLSSFLHGHFIMSRKLYLVFHAWEIVIVLALLSLKWGDLIPLVVGMGTHLLTDTLMHFRNNPAGYFILYRRKHRFAFDKINYYLFERQMKSLRESGLLDAMSDGKK